MSAAVVGFLLELLLCAAGVYVYLFARGIVRFGRAATRERAEAFRAENATWLRLLGLGLAAVMGLNLVARLL